MPNTRIITCALAAAGVLFIGSQARAQAPGQIFACVNNSSGTIHVIAPNATCNNNEILLVWNTVGPQGLAGPQGAVGPIGPRWPDRPRRAAGTHRACGPGWTDRAGRPNGTAGA